jgi:hypothetical protein
MNLLEIKNEHFAPFADGLSAIGLAGARSSVGALYSEALGSLQEVPPPVVRLIHCAMSEHLAHS